MSLSSNILLYDSLLLTTMSDNSFTLYLRSSLLGSCSNCGSIIFISRTA
nr:MAG TPA: hypothetical protein [Caudoviricetes sp.]